MIEFLRRLFTNAGNLSLHRRLDYLTKRINQMSLDLSLLTGAVNDAIAKLGSDAPALAQAQADLAAAQTEITTAQATVNDLTAKLRAALPTT